jgi:putative ABC transport system permease protein
LRALDRKTLRDLVANRTQVIAVIVIVLLGALVFTALSLAPRGLRASLARTYRQTGYEDFSITVAGAPSSAVREAAAVPGVAAVEGRIVRESPASIKGRELTVRTISLPDGRRPSVDSLLLESGAWPAGAPTAGGAQAAADHHLASEFDLRPGDRVSMLSFGGRTPVVVSAGAVSPEYMRLVSGRDSLLTDPAQFGVIFMPESSVLSLYGPSDYNSFVFRVKSGENPSAVMERARAVLSRYGVVAATLGTQEQSYRLTNMDLNNIANMAVFFTLMFLWVSALAIYITVSRLTYTQQKQVGAARALGYSRRSITGHFLSYGLVIGLAGGLIGAGLGLLVGKFFISWYGKMLGFPPVHGPTSPLAIMLGAVLISVVLSTIGALVPAVRGASLKPADAMRNEAGVSTTGSHGRKKARPRRSRLPLVVVKPFRDMARARWRTVLTVAGLTITVAGVVTGSFAIESINHAFDKQFTSVYKWDVSAYVRTPDDVAALTAARGVKGIDFSETAILLPASIESGAKSADVIVGAYDPDTKLHGWFPEGGSPKTPPPGGILLGNSLKKQGFKVGDSLRVTSLLGEYTARVDGFVAEPFGGVSYVNPGPLATGTGSLSQGNAMFVRALPGQIDAVAASLRRVPGIAKVETKAATKQGLQLALDKAIKPMMEIVMLLVLMIGTAIVFTMVSINVMERRRELATMRTLGTGWGRMLSGLEVETLTVCLLSFIPGAFLGWFMGILLFTKVMTSDQMTVQLYVSPVMLVVFAVIFLALAAVSVLPPLCSAMRMDLASATRER